MQLPQYDRQALKPPLQRSKCMACGMILIGNTEHGLEIAERAHAEKCKPTKPFIVRSSRIREPETKKIDD